MNFDQFFTFSTYFYKFFSYFYANFHILTFQYFFTIFNEFFAFLRIFINFLPNFSWLRYRIFLWFLVNFRLFLTILLIFHFSFQIISQRLINFRHFLHKSVKIVQNLLVSIKIEVFLSSKTERLVKHLDTAIYQRFSN